MESQTGLYEGDRIRLDDCYGHKHDCTVERFRDCLRLFLTDQHRKTGDFLPLCEMYGFGTGSEMSYMSNLGKYVKNPVPLWMQLTSSA